METRIEELEGHLANARSAARSLPARSYGAVTVHATSPVRIAAGVLIATLLNALIAFACSLAWAWGAPTGLYQIILLIETLPSIGLAVWLSYRERVPWALAIPWGFIKALLGTAAYLTMVRWSQHFAPVNSPVFQDFEHLIHFLRGKALLVLFLPALATFYSSFWLGCSLGKKRGAPVAKSQLVAPRQGGAAEAVQDTGNWYRPKPEGEIQLWNGLITALTPVLSVAGAVSTALLGFLAALHGGPAK